MIVGNTQEKNLKTTYPNYAYYFYKYISIHNQNMLLGWKRLRGVIIAIVSVAPTQEQTSIIQSLRNYGTNTQEKNLVAFKEDGENDFKDLP